MADIAMCSGDNCPSKDHCYRHTAKPNPVWQTYMSAPPVKEGGKCSYYWKDEYASSKLKDI